MTTKPTWRHMKAANKVAKGTATLDVPGGVDSVVIRGRDVPLDVLVGDNGALTVGRDGHEITLAIRDKQLVIVVEGQSKDEKIRGFALNVPNKPDVEGAA